MFLDVDPDDGIAAGRKWEDELYLQLRRAQGVVFLASRASVASKWCAVEVSLARSVGKPVFPLALGDSPRLSILADAQWIDFGPDGDAAINRLVGGLRDAGLDPAQSFWWDTTRSPYPGLQAFDREDAAVFFGRKTEVDRILDLLHPTLERGSGRFVAVVGPSGSGKSSLVNAGVLPRLAREKDHWTILPRVVPGTRPTANLLRSLRAAFGAGQHHSTEELRQALDSGSGALIDLCHELCDLAGTEAVLLVLDQAEELFTRTAPGEREQFLDLLEGAAHGGGPLWVLATVRSEFLSGSSDQRKIAEIIDDSVLIEPLSRARMPEVIERPAQRGGVVFAPGLVQRMVEDTMVGDALPLLAYTLLQLYERNSHGAPITLEDYEAVGGVIGALRGRADRVMDEFTRLGERELVLPTLVKLATIERDAEPTRRRINRADLTREEDRVVDGFVSARLLKVEGDGQEATVEVAHEALLRQWTPLAEALKDSRESIQMRTELERLAQDWERAGRDDSYVLRGARLEQAVAWAADPAADIGKLEREFIKASRESAGRELAKAQAEVRRLRRSRAIMSVGLILLLAAVSLAIVALLQRGTALKNARASARTAQSELLVQQTTNAVDPQVGGLLAIEAYRLSPTTVDARNAILSVANSQQLGMPLAGHTKDVYSVAYTPDGSTLASAGADGTIRLWNVATRQQIGRPLGAGTEPVNHVAFSPDGKMLASAGWDGKVRLWNVASHRQIGNAIRVGTATVSDVAFSPNGKTLASASSDHTVHLWNVASHRQIGPALAGINVAFSPDGKTLAAASADHTIRLWDVATHHQIGPAFVGHNDTVSSLAFSPDRKTLASGSWDDTIRLWDVATHRQIGQPLTGHTNPVNSVAFSPDGKTLASASSDHTIRLWDVASHHQIGAPLTGHTDFVYGVAFSPDGKTLASASSDDTVRLWDVASPRQIGPALVGHTSLVNSVAFSPDGSTLASASNDHTIRLWDVASHRQIGQPLTGHSKAVTSVVFSPDGKLLASASWDQTIRLWDVANHRQIGQPLTGHAKAVNGVAFSPDGKMLASASSDDTIRLWDVASHRQIGQPLTGHSKAVTSVAFSPDGKTLASGSWDHTVRLWDVASHRQVGLLIGHRNAVTSVAFSPDGKTLASASYDGTIGLWNVASRRQIASLTGDNDIIASVAFSRDGKTLASASWDHMIRLWDVASHQQIGPPLAGDFDAVASVAFGPNGNTLASASSDGTVRLWNNFPIEYYIRQLCTHFDPLQASKMWAENQSSNRSQSIPYQKPCG